MILGEVNVIAKPVGDHVERTGADGARRAGQGHAPDEDIRLVQINEVIDDFRAGQIIGCCVIVTDGRTG